MRWVLSLVALWRARCLQQHQSVARFAVAHQRVARGARFAQDAQQTTRADQTAEEDGGGVASSDDEEPAFRAWLAESLAEAPRRDLYGPLYEECAEAVVRWRRRFYGDPALWKRLMKERVVKELIECAPVIAATRDFVAASGDPARRVTIVDLCSGKGYLSMFLSEVLPADRVERCVLVDKAWPRCFSEPKPGHINWDHIYGTHPGGARSYFESWPIPLTTSKQDLKGGPSTTRGMVKAVFDRSEGPIAILAVHLCGTLSLRALDLFNTNDRVAFMVLKPCCLPPMIHANRNETFTVGDHAFDAADVCSHGRFRGSNWIGPPRHTMQPKFERWARHLERGARVRGGGRKGLEESAVQTKGGYQNSFIFAEHDRATRPLWDGIRARGRMPS